MINQIPFILKLSVTEHRRLVALKPWSGKWDDATVADIKANIKQQLVDSQFVCAYCGLPFKGSKDKQIEHIAPKANFRQPQFTYTLQNLVLSCGYCNDLIVKGTKETIDPPVKRSYKENNFLIVHPYFDDPDEYYEWTDMGDKILIQVRNDEDKAKYSITMFGLDSEEMSGWRAAFSLLQKQKAAKPIVAADETLVDNTLKYKT